MRRPRLFIFDWDGTLMDSAHQIVSCMQRAAADLGLAMPDKGAISEAIGLGLPEVIQLLFPAHPADLRERIKQTYARHYIAEVGGPSQLFQGARELLHGLRADQALLAVATGKSRAGLDRVLLQSELVEVFHVSRCADETASKPDPRMLFEILEAVSVSPDEAVMIGDTTYDLEMAAKAGVRSIGIAHGVHEAEALEMHSPLRVLPDLLTLAPYLASL